MKFTTTFIALGALTFAVNAQEASPTESVGCEAHGEHWHCDGPRETSVAATGSTAASMAPTIASEPSSHHDEDEHDHEHTAHEDEDDQEHTSTHDEHEESETDAASAGPSPTESAGCHPHGDHWHCDSPANATSAAGNGSASAPAPTETGNSAAGRTVGWGAMVLACVVGILSL